MQKQTGNRSAFLDKQGFLFKWRWWIFCLLAAVYIAIELAEHPLFGETISYFMVFEILLLIIPVGIIVYLFGVILTAVAEKDHAFQLLDEKNQLLFQLAKARDWDSLVTSIVKFPGMYTHILQAFLQVYDESSQSFQVEALWMPEDEVELRPASFNLLANCSTCCQEIDNASKSLRPCDYLHNQKDSTAGQGYCLPLFYGAKLIAMLCFALPAQAKLDSQAESILNASTNEIASALIAATERRARLASELSNAARGERLLIARDLHDTLGQYLGYLHLKLDQFTREDFLSTVEQMEPDLERMHLVADEAYELVRGGLAIMHQDDDVRMKLCELIEIHGRLVANRSNLDFSLSCQGKSGILPLQIVRQVYYAVKEALYNIERHARARQVTVTLEWGLKDLTINIVDDGVGFDPQAVEKDRHFGLDIMRERIETCKGRFSLESTPGAGTHVTLWLPATCEEPQVVDEKVNFDPFMA